jgi:predicted nucleic acid-binding protein
LKLVLDASVAVDACLSEGGFAILVDHDLVAPPLLLSETLAALRGLRWRRDISAALATAALRQLQTMPVTLERPGGHVAAAWALATRLGWAKTYDAEYVVLAEMLQLPLLTRDARLARTVESIVTVIPPDEL